MANDFWFRYGFLNMLQDDLLHARRQSRLTLYHFQWAMTTLLCMIFGGVIGGETHGWLGAVVGLPIGLVGGLLLGWLFFGAGVFLMTMIFRFFHWRGWFK